MEEAGCEERPYGAAAGHGTDGGPARRRVECLAGAARGPAWVKGVEGGPRVTK